MGVLLAPPPPPGALPSWELDPTVGAYLELDLLGNVRRMRDANGVDLGGYRYSAFGKILEDSAAAPPGYTGYFDPRNNVLRWKGRPRDVIGGVEIYDMRARWWVPEMGAFLSVDEYAFHDPRTTLWGWPGQNPYRWSDPTGREGFSLTLGLGLTLGSTATTGGGVLAGVSEVALPVGFVTAGVSFIGWAAWDTQHQWDEFQHPTVNYGDTGILESKTVRKSNDARVQAARDALERLRQELESLQQKPQKDPDDKDKIERLKRAIQRQIDRMRRSEEHARRGQRSFIPPFDFDDEDKDCP